LCLRAGLLAGEQTPLGGHFLVWVKHSMPQPLSASDRIGWRALSWRLALMVATVLACPLAAQQADQRVPLERQVNAFRAECAAAVRQGQAAQEKAYLADYPIARLQLRKAEALLGQGQYFIGGALADDIDSFVRQGRAALAALEKGEVLFAGQTGDLELAYEAHSDGSFQPYYVHVPAQYDPAKPTPLVIFLHGYVPDTTILRPWTPWEDVTAPAERLGFVFLTPYGRRNSDFEGPGEVDVLDAIAETKRWFNIDEDRLYLFGVSMGGYGAWNLGLRHPGMFAALGPISGHTDMMRWTGLERRQIPFFRRWLFEWDNPYDLAENACGLPLHLMHGATDTLIATEQSRLMVQRLRELGYEIDYSEVQGNDHWIYFGPEVYEATIPWFEPFRREPWPQRVVCKTYSLRYDTAYWLRIDQLGQWAQPALIEANVEGNNIGVKAENVAAYTLKLGGQLADPTAEVTIATNGQQSFKGRVPETGEVTVFLDRDYENGRGQGLWKRKGLCGPVEDAYCYPFLVVMGTTAKDEARGKQVEANTQRFRQEWDAYADGLPRWKKDTEVTPQDIEQYNLVCFGEPDTNAILARCADGLPIKLQGRGYVTPAGKYEGDKIGLQMIYPNPLNPSKYLVVISGYYYGERLMVNHKHDLVPDFIIYDDQLAGERGSPQDVYFGLPNHHLYAGFFDRQWRLANALTSVGVKPPQ